MYHNWPSINTFAVQKDKEHYNNFVYYCRERIKLKEILYIKNDVELVQPVLFLQLGDNYFYYAIVNKNVSTLHELALCNVDQMNSDTLFSFIKKYPSLKEEAFYDIQVSFSGSFASFTPIINNEDIIKNTIGVNENTIVITERVSEWQLTNLYLVNKDLWNWIQENYPTAKFRHRYTLDLKNAISNSIGGVVQVDFYNSGFTTIVSVNNKLLFAGNFEYANTDDVLYILLKLCHHFSLSQNELILQLSGLIEQNSALYKELYLYFSNINFRNVTWQSKNTDYPSHYFTSLNDLAACVS